MKTKKATPKATPKAAPKKEEGKEGKQEKVLVDTGKIKIVRAAQEAKEEHEKRTTAVAKAAGKTVDKKPEAKPIKVEKEAAKATLKKEGGRVGTVIGTEDVKLVDGIKKYAVWAKEQGKEPSFWRCVHRLRDDKGLSFSHARLRKLWDKMKMAA